MRSVTPNATRDGETAFVETAGQRVRYRVRGDGPPLLMIHGIGAPLELWRPLESKLSDFRTITVDPPGTGHSSTPRGRFGLARHAEVMDDLLTHLGLDSANVLGLSLGGMIAQELARRSPERVEKLVLASTSCGLKASLMAALGATPARFRPRPQVERAPTISSDPSLLRLQWEAMGEYTPSVRGYVGQLRAAVTWSSRSWLGELEMPVLVIAGDDDPVVPLANGRIIASSVRDGRLEVIPGGGHLCLFKEPVYTSQLIRDFLRAQAPRAPVPR
jgi:pimeloyl-ACP methyl ester carboxylesterase